MFISSKTFYERHAREVKRYVDPADSSLHLINEESDYGSQDLKEKVVRIQFNDFEKIESLIQNNEKFYFVIITDLFELSEDIFLFLTKIGTILEKEGKLLITSINPKWNKILRFFEIIKIKKKTNNRSYINPKKK